MTLDIPSGSLASGDKVRLILTYVDGDVTTWQSQDFTVTAPLTEDSVAFVDTEFTTDTDSATIIVSGYSNFIGGYLFVTMGRSNDTDADERKQIGSVKFTGEGTSRGLRLRNILSELNIPTMTVGYDQLNETVRYLVGLDGYAATDQPYSGTKYDIEFMLMCNLPESLLDTFLDKKQENNLRIDHKAIVTEYNREYKLYELMGDIGDEHNAFTALIKLNSLVKKAEQLKESEYGSAPDWDLLQNEIQAANALISSEDRLTKI